tara:strand:- start:453 stop:914 length:462 start_codon:yes stop_codon:yes gene_type:complete
MYSLNILQQIYSHSIEEYPFECCGVVLESAASDEQEVLRCKNIQNEIHKSDPEKNPRDAHTAYSISPADLLKIHGMMHKQHYKLKAVYHSHPDNKAYFSEEDYSFAAFNDEPIYPGTDYIIVSIVKKRVEETTCFSWDSKSKKFSGRTISKTC